MSTELAKAYVQIVPSAKGISGSLSGLLGGEASSAGNNAGERVGVGLIGTLKKALAVAGIGKFIGNSITQGAALEQSLGGVETLFKDNADTVKQYAAQAYQTAGVSANDYMEMVTGFSASLLQSTAGDTASAAEIANTAMVDMSDNANKMGTNIGDIQNAYQGFAKQNYTMLDNLKLGYGGTKTEMQRLLDDANKYNAAQGKNTDYQLENYADIIAAIHDVQGELDITGTTAQEASTTLSGSMTAMKSAFSNVMGGLALGQDITPALQGLVQTTTTFLVGNLIPAVWNIVSAVPSSIVTLVQAAVPQIATAFMQFLPELQEGMTQSFPALLAQGVESVNSLMAGITQSLPEMLQKGTELINNLVTGALNQLPIVVDSAFQVMTGFLSMVTENLPAMMQSGASILTNIVTGILNNLPQIVTSAGTTVLTLIQGIVTHLPEIISTGFDILTNLIAGIGNAIPDIVNAAGDVATSFKDAIANTDWITLGKNIIDGIISGISQMGGALWDAAVNIAKSAESAIKDFFGIASPSRLMRDEVGKFIPLGLAAGITENGWAVTDAMDGISGLAQREITAKLAAETRLSAQPGGAIYNPANNVPVVNQTIYAAKQTPVELAATTKAYFQRARWAMA